MRKSIVVLTCAAVLMSAFAMRRFAPKTPKDGAQASEDDVGTLRREVQELRGRVSTEAINTAALTKVALSAPAATPVGADKEGFDAPATLLDKPPTQEQMVATFGQYFEQLDALRGTSSDPQLTRKFEEVLSTEEWNRGAAEAPSTKKVSCNNGYCRVSLGYENAADAQAARSKLMLAMARLTTGLAIYFDPATLHVEGYFSTGETTLPPLTPPNG